MFKDSETMEIEFEDVEARLTVGFRYYKSVKGRVYTRHGDPGEPFEPAYAEIEWVKAGRPGQQVDITGIIGDEQWEQLVDIIIAEKERDDAE